MTLDKTAPMNLAHYAIGRAAARTPEKPALLVIDSLADEMPAETWTYRSLEDAVLKTAGALITMGLKPGDRVMIRLENTSAYAILFFGAAAAGLVPLPASNQLTDTEALYLAENSGAALIASATPFDVSSLTTTPRVIGPTDVATMIAQGPKISYAPTRADDPAFLIYTSGTTAHPKGVLHAHRSVLGRTPMYQGWYGISEQDRVLHAGAFNWTFTLGTGLTDPWANGATAIVFTGEKSPQIWPRLIGKTGATIFAAVPGLMRQILKYASPTPDDMPTLRHGLIAGENPPATLFDDWRRATGTELYEGFGMSELSTYISSSPGVPRKYGAAGKPQPGRCVVILPADAGEAPLPPGEEGLIAVHRSDPGLMLGYWNRPDEEAQVFRGEWFLGGDLGIMDAEGYITHKGRNNDIMKALGYRVSPLEVEAAISAHPDVAEVACAAMSVREDVTIIAAFIVPKPGATPSADAMRAFAETRLAAYKRPRDIHFVDALPRTPNGKVKRSALATLACATAPQLAPARQTS